MWKWLTLEGDPKNKGWRGVDKALLERIPIPVPQKDVQLKVAKLTQKLEKELTSSGDTTDTLQEIESIVSKAFGL